MYRFGFPVAQSTDFWNIVLGRLQVFNPELKETFGTITINFALGTVPVIRMECKTEVSYQSMPNSYRSFKLNTFISLIDWNISKQQIEFSASEYNNIMLTEVEYRFSRFCVYRITFMNAIDQS